jgi:hypothetical protein
MVNLRKVKSYGSYFIASLIPLFALTATLITTYDLLIAVIISIIFLFPTIIIARNVSDTPLRRIDEGEGLMIIDLNSKGIIKTYTATIKSPFINIRTNEKEISTLYDRDASFSFELPEDIKQVQYVEKDGKKYLVMELPEKKHYFQFENFYPTFIINTNAGFIYDKERIGKLEEKYMTKTDLNYLKVKLDELSAILRDFARYVVEQLKPKPSIFGNWIIWLIIMLIIGLVLVMVMNYLPSLVSNPIQTATQTGGGVIVGTR